MGTRDLIPAMPPQLEHGWVTTTRRHRVDATRRAIHALNAQKALVFMNFQKRLQVRCQQHTMLRPLPCALHCSSVSHFWLTPISWWVLCDNEVWLSRLTQDTEAKLAASNMKVATLSGDLTKEQRKKVLANFRKGAYRALIVSGSLSRADDSTLKNSSTDLLITAVEIIQHCATGRNAECQCVGRSDGSRAGY